MVYFELTKVKELLGETGDTNNVKINRYGQMADNFINSDLSGVEPTIPISPVPDIVTKIANEITVAYFYKFENGDTTTAEQAEETWIKYFTGHYKRPRFYITSGTY